MQANIKQSAPVNDVFRPRNTQVPVAGKIRPGIKVLTKAAKSDIPNAEKIYDEGISVGASFEAIEKKLKNANPKFPRRPLTPRNCETFRCNQDDFNAPGAAQAIIDLHGEDHGDGIQLYSFPIMFPSDNIPDIFRQKFESWTSRELQYWSEFDNTGTLSCIKRQEVKHKNSRRRFGGRSTEVVKPCDPNTCDIFANEKCNHNCSLVFYVPGCAGVGLIELGFSSIYAALQIQQQLEMVLTGLGRIKGSLNLEPIFRITKTLDNVSRVDYKNGEVTRENQYIIKLEAVGLDMSQIFIEEEQRALGLSAPLTETTSKEIAIPTPEPNTNNNNAIDVEPEPSIADDRKNVFDRAKSLQLTTEQFGNWGIKKYGKQAFKKNETLQKIKRNLTEAETSGDISTFIPTDVTAKSVEDNPKKGAPF